MPLCGKEMAQSLKESKVELAASVQIERMRLHSFAWQSSNSYRRSQHEAIMVSPGINGESLVALS